MKKINLCFFALLILFTQVIICDNLIYFFKASYLIGNIIALIVNIGIFAILIRKKKIKIETNFNKFDLIFIAILLVITGLTIIYPDTFWDSYSYHIYLQQNPFADKINLDFFPGRTLTSFVYPIADRIFYMFRTVLGFRLGTLPGYFLIAVMFYQIKKYLNKLIGEKIADKYISMLSILPLGVFIILQQLGIYYIDNFSVVMLLEILYIVLFEKENIFKEKSRLYYLAYIVGICVCTKITNAVYVALPLVYMLIKNIKDIKNIKIYDYLLLICTFVISMLPYMIDAVVQTGSPVFPYYNSIFKSEYFQEINWLDDRYGPKNLIQFLLWPIYILIEPKKAYEVGNTDLMFAIGYIISFILIIYEIIYKKIMKKQEINKKLLEYAMVLIYLYIVWEKFVIGYTRYAGIIPVLASIISIYFLISSIKNSKIILILVFFTVICGSSVAGLYEYTYYGSGQNYLRLFTNIEDENVVTDIKNNIKKNIKKTLLCGKDTQKYDIDGVWGVLYDDSGVPTLLNVDDRIVELQYGTKTGKTEKTDKLYWNNVLNNDIYMPIYEDKMAGTLAYLNKYSFEIIDIVDTLTNVNFLGKSDYIYIAKVKYDNEKYERNQISMLTCTENQLEVKTSEKTKENKLTFVATINGRVINKDTDEVVTINIIAQKDGEEKIIDTVTLKSDGKSINYEKDLSNIEYDSIKISLDQEELKLRRQNHSITVLNTNIK